MIKWVKDHVTGASQSLRVNPYRLVVAVQSGSHITFCRHIMLSIYNEQHFLNLWSAVCHSNKLDILWGEQDME